MLLVPVTASILGASAAVTGFKRTSTLSYSTYMLSRSDNNVNGVYDMGGVAPDITAESLFTADGMMFKESFTISGHWDWSVNQAAGLRDSPFMWSKTYLQSLVGKGSNSGHNPAGPGSWVTTSCYESNVNVSDACIELAKERGDACPCVGGGCPWCVP